MPDVRSVPPDLQSPVCAFHVVSMPSILDDQHSCQRFRSPGSGHRIAQKIPGWVGGKIKNSSVTCTIWIQWISYTSIQLRILAFNSKGELLLRLHLRHCSRAWDSQEAPPSSNTPLCSTIFFEALVPRLALGSALRSLGRCVPRERCQGTFLNFSACEELQRHRRCFVQACSVAHSNMYHAEDP